MTTRRNSSQGFGTMDSDERRRSSRRSRQTQGRSQNRDEYENDYEDYDDEDTNEYQGNRYMNSSRNQHDWDEDDDYNRGSRGRMNMRSESDYEDDYDDYSGSGNWEGQGRNRSRGYGYDDEYNDRNSGSSYSRRGFGSMSREMGSGYGGNSGYGNGSRNQYSRDQNGGRSSRSRMGSEYGDSSDYGYRRGRNQFSGSEYGIGGPNDNWGTGSNEGRSRRGYSEDQYLGRGQNRATRYDDDYDRPERSNRSGNRENYRMGRQSGFSSSTRRNGRSSNR